jgi:hypothetical protein
MKRRPRRAIPATVLALALLGGCAVVLLSLVQRLAGTGEFVSLDTVARRLHDTAWDDPWVADVATAAVPVGFALLTAAVLPGRPVVLPLTADDEIVAGIARRGLQLALRDAAQSIEGVHSVRVRLHRGRIRILARADRAHLAGLPDTVRAAVDERLTRIGPCPTPPVSTRVRQAGGRR